MSLAGYESFYRELRKRNIKIPKKHILNWLRSQDSYTLHTPIKKKFKRNHVFTTGIDHIWQADLCDVSNLSSFNNNFNYLLTCIDVFSKYAWAVPLKNKTALSIIKGFEKIFKSSKRKPDKLQTDEGKEFFNKSFKIFLDKNKIHQRI